MLNSHDKPPRVLLVEDTPFLRYAFGRLLRLHGFDVCEVNDGREALDCIADFHPQLILTDLMMPVMNGWEFARMYRERPGPHAPIVIVTAALDVAKDARDIGADGFLAKPFQLDDLLDLVERHVTTPG